MRNIDFLISTMEQKEQEQKPLEVLEKDLESVQKYLLHVWTWLDLSSYNCEFNDSLIGILLKKYPHLWKLETEKFGHEKTGFVEDKTATLQTKSFRIVIKNEGGPRNHVCTCQFYMYEKASYCLYNGGSDEEKDGVVNEKMFKDKWKERANIICGRKIVNYFPQKNSNQNIPNPKWLSFSRYHHYSEDEVLSAIQETVGFKDLEFTNDVVCFIFKMGTTRWKKEIVKEGHERTGWVIDENYTFEGPVTIIITKAKALAHGNTVKILLNPSCTNLADETVKSEVQTKEKVNYEIETMMHSSTINFKIMDEILDAIPKPIEPDIYSNYDEKCKELNCQEYIYIVLRKSASKGGWSAYKHSTSFKKAIYYTMTNAGTNNINILMRISLSTLLQSNTMMEWIKNPRIHETDVNVLQNGKVLMMLDCTPFGRYRKIYLDENNQVKTDLNDFSGHYEATKQSKKELCDKHCL
jgi:hypothetical protein